MKIANLIITNELTLWVRTPFMARCTRYNVIFMW